MRIGIIDGSLSSGLKKTLAVFVIGLLAAPALLFGEAAGKLKVKAYNDSECRSHPATIEIPAGKTGQGLESPGVKPGTACHDEGAPENVGFAIRDQKGGPVYMWSRYKEQPPYEKGGPLSKVRLVPGEYTLTVAGGAGAEIELSYELK